MSSYVCVRARKMKKLKMRGMKIQVAKIAARVTQKYVFFVKIVSGISLVDRNEVILYRNLFEFRWCVC